MAETPTGACDPLAIIRQIGFVQLDSIQVVARAHHHILWTRNQNYRETQLHRLMARERGVFEHFTHDASALPMAFLPMWRRQFDRMRRKVEKSSWYGDALSAELLDNVLKRIEAEGPLCSRAFDTKITGQKEMWQRPPHKKALDYLWYSGILATCHRDGFTKFYDLAERVFPSDLASQKVEDEEQIDWLCQSALDRIGFGTLGELRRFWDATEVAEVNAWAERHAADLVPVEIQSADGSWTSAIAVADIEARLAQSKAPTSRLRLLNPFDPAIRDRVRLKRLFGFDYTVEMFVPAAKRQWGYYVFPMLEGSRFVGRIEVKADRSKDCLKVLNLWWEPGVRISKERSAKLESELARLCRFVGVSSPP